MSWKLDINQDLLLLLLVTTHLGLGCVINQIPNTFQLSELVINRFVLNEGMMPGNKLACADLTTEERLRLFSVAVETFRTVMLSLAEFTSSSAEADRDRGFQRVCRGITPPLAPRSLSSWCLYLNLNNHIAAFLWCSVPSLCFSRRHRGSKPRHVPTCDVMSTLVFTFVCKSTSVPGRD